MKEAYYVMKLFSNHVSLSIRCYKMSHTYQNRGETVIKRFFYPEPMDINFLYCHQIDDHNHYRHQQIGLDNGWGTNFWGYRVFTLLFYVTEINTYKLHHHFKEGPEVNFRLLV